MVCYYRDVKKTKAAQLTMLSHQLKVSLERVKILEKSVVRSALSLSAGHHATIYLCKLNPEIKYLDVYKRFMSFAGSNGVSSPEGSMEKCLRASGDFAGVEYSVWHVKL